MVYQFWHHFEHYIHKYGGLGSFFGAICGAVISGSVVLVVAIYYTRRLNKINATLNFSRRFHDLLTQQQILNNKFAEDHPVPVPVPNDRDKLDGEAWWWRFFDLMLYEYDFRRHGQLDRKRFCEWMTWRWYDFNGWHGRVWQTCGVSYADGWRYWKRHPAVQKNPLIPFLDDVHGASDPQAAERRVRLYSTCLGRCWRRFTKRLNP